MSPPEPMVLVASVISMALQPRVLARSATVVNDIQAASDLPSYDEQALRVMLRDLELNPPSLFIIVKWSWYTLDNERYAIDNLPALRSYVEQHFPGPPVQENDRYLILKRGDG